MPSPTLSSSTSIITPSDDDFINALISDLKWSGAGEAAVNLTYSFPWASSGTAVFTGPGGVYSSLNEYSAAYHYGLNATQQAAVRMALQSWANIANIRFTEIAETNTNVGDLRFAWTSATETVSTGGKAWGWTRFPSSYWPSAGDVWISTDASGATDQDWSSGSSNFSSLIHELGHALGLKHSFKESVQDDSTVLPAAWDSSQYTVMSYTDHSHSRFVRLTEDSDSFTWTAFTVQPDTPMLFDLAAIQYLYGANLAFKTGDDVYTFDPDTPFFRTLWDAGGTDTISVSNFSKGCIVNLQQGQFSKITIESDSTDGVDWSSPPPTPTYDGTDNLAIAFGCEIENAIGGGGNDHLIGNSDDNNLKGGGGNDVIEGGDGSDVAAYSGNLSAYRLSKTGGSYTVRANAGTDGTDTITGVESLKFTDKTVNLTVQAVAGAAPTANVHRLEELYVAFFNRVPDADGLSYWIGQMGAGQSLDQIAESFYSAGIQYSSLTGFSSTMSNADFVNVIYKNVLGRSGTTAPPDADVSYWANQLATGADTRGSLTNTMLGSAHTFKGNSTWGWVADLLDNKIAVANKFAVEWGLNYNTPIDSIAYGMAIMAAITPTDTSTAIGLVGVTGSNLQLA